MNKMIKTVAVMLTVFSFATAQAGVLEVTGNAKMSYVITGSDSATAVLESSKGLGVANEFSLGASGEGDADPKGLPIHKTGYENGLRIYKF